MLMKKEIISSKQGAAMMLMFTIGSTLIIGGSRQARQDAWISILLSMLMALPIYLIYARILRLFPNKGLFDIVEELFGKVFSKIIILLFTWYFFHLASMIIRNITEFIQIASFPETPQFFVALLIGILCIYIVKSGIEVLGRLVEFILPIVLLIILLTIMASIPKMNWMNIKPVLYNGWQPVISRSFYLFSFPFAETIIFTIIFSTLPTKSNPYKIYLLNLIISSLLLLLISLRNILILGNFNVIRYYFPTYTVVSLIHLGEFLDRIEIIVSAIFVFSSIIKTSLCLFATSIGTAKLFHLDNYKPLASPLCLLILNVSFILYQNAMEMFNWLEIYSYYALLFQLVLPIFIWIVAEIKTRYSAKI